MKIITLPLLILSACTSLPKGEPQLKKMMIDDHPRESQGRFAYVHSGRPVYIESTSYPFLLPDGHISMGGNLLVFVGREELSLNELIPAKDFLKEEDQSQLSPISVPKDKDPTPFIREFGGPKLAESQAALPAPSFPKTPGAESLEEFLKLEKASISRKDQRFVNHLKCAKPKITRNGNCEQLQVEFDLSRCLGSPFVRQGHKVSCADHEALFGVKLNNVRYRVMTNRPPLPVMGHWNLNTQIQVTFYKP